MTGKIRRILLILFASSAVLGISLLYPKSIHAASIEVNTFVDELDGDGLVTPTSGY